MTLSVPCRTHIPISAILLFYSPESVKESFFSSILTIYSILITCLISIFQKNLTKFHALIAATIVGSPLTMYMGLYALRSLWGNKHRLDDIVGRGKIVQRTMVLGTVAIWMAFVIYLLLPSNISYFAQASCDQYSLLVKFFFFIPILLFAAAVIYAPVLAAAAVTPIIGVALSWVLIIIIRRRTIWPNASTKRWQFWAVWFVQNAALPMRPFLLICVYQQGAGARRVPICVLHVRSRRAVHLLGDHCRGRHHRVASRQRVHALLRPGASFPYLLCIARLVLTATTRCSRCL